MGCGACHVNAAGKIAPSLAGLFGAPVSLEGGETIFADEAYIRESILFPQRKVVIGYDPVMPPYERRIDDEQLAALVEYIKSLGEEG
jgi:cytochrome c oxidase subunit 2